MLYYASFLLCVKVSQWLVDVYKQTNTTQQTQIKFCYSEKPKKLDKISKMLASLMKNSGKNSLEYLCVGM